MDNSSGQQVQRIQHYYQFQSRIYDLTRWSFLFGRSKILRLLPFQRHEAINILEVGCGTGRNLALLSKRFPKANLFGMDVSEDMLTIAGKRLEGNTRVQLIGQPYMKNTYSWTGKIDVVLFSYALTMINPQWPSLLAQAFNDLRPGGCIAFVDFHYSQFAWFRKHMSGHHVRMEAHILPVLKEDFEVVHSRVHNAYLGVWQYCMFIGRKPSS